MNNAQIRTIELLLGRSKKYLEDHSDDGECWNHNSDARSCELVADLTYWLEKAARADAAALLAECQERISGFMTFYGMDREIGHPTEDFIWRQAHQTLAKLKQFRGE